MNQSSPELLRAVTPLLSRLQRGLGELGFSRKEIRQFITRRIFEEEGNGSGKDLPQMLQKILRGEETQQGSDTLRLRLIHLLTRLEIEVGILEQYDRQTASPSHEWAAPASPRNSSAGAQRPEGLEAQADKQHEQYVTLARLQEKISSNLEQVSELRSMFMKNTESVRDRLQDDVFSYRSKVKQPSDRLGNIFSSRRAAEEIRQRRIELERDRLRELQRLREMERERMMAREQELMEMERVWQLQRENKEVELMLSNVSSFEHGDDLDEYAEF